MVDVGDFDIINHNKVFRSTATPYRQVIGLIAYFSDTGQAGNDTIDIAARARGPATRASPHKPRACGTAAFRARGPVNGAVK